MQALCGRLSRRRLAMARGRRLRSRGCGVLGRCAVRSGGEYPSMPASESEVLVGRRYLERGFLDAAMRLFVRNAELVTAADWTSLGEHLLERNRIPEDRKSTRLNSSHITNSYAVFCLKKKIQQ